MQKYATYIFNELCHKFQTCRFRYVVHFYFSSRNDCVFEYSNETKCIWLIRKANKRMKCIIAENVGSGSQANEIIQTLIAFKLLMI